MTPPREPKDHDYELRRHLERYLRDSDDPPAGSSARDDLIRLMAAKIEHLERSRDSLAAELGTHVSDTGTFAPLEQTTIDLMMSRQELAREREKSAALREQLASKQAELVKASDRRFDIAVRTLFALGGAVFAYVVGKLTGH